MTQVIAHREGIDPVKGGIKFQVAFSGHDLDRHVAQAAEGFMRKTGMRGAWLCEKQVVSPEGKVLARIMIDTRLTIHKVALTFTPPEM